LEGEVIGAGQFRTSFVWIRLHDDLELESYQNER
jgi:hypothetical protein